MSPNATAALVVAAAVLMVIVAFKGTQDNWVTAILGHAPSWVTPAPAAPSSSTSSGVGGVPVPVPGVGFVTV